MKKINNKYFVLRHGESKANVLEIILSHLKDGMMEEFTLSEKGEQQVRDSVKKEKNNGELDEKTIIYSSPFSRTKKTAEIAREVLGVKEEITFDNRLRERWFGELDKTHNSNYHKIWSKDGDNPNHKDFGSESAMEVGERIVSLFEDLEEKYKNRNILLVSHADILLILQAYINGNSPATHRSLEYLLNAEIRKLN
ncbi:MAG: histidine phosphatase family protein [Candidatus Staskawiczbacteria bacterium]|jgi:probable phosphoglycerate mutase